VSGDGVTSPAPGQSLRLLMLAYHFPPIGGGGVQRNAKFARYLPDHGISPVVVTGPGRSDDRWAPNDGTLTSDIPASVVVHRLKNPEPPPTGSLRSALERRLMLPTPTVRWWMSGAESLGAEVGVGCDLIYASLIPYDTGQTAARLSRALGIPWVADLQDPWALDEMWLYPSALHRGIDRRRMRRVLGSAAAIVMNTPEAARRLVGAFPELSGHRVVSIPNGFDHADFAASVSPRTDGRFRIVHAGYLHTDQGLRLRRTRWARKWLGGTYVPIDVLTRSHVFLLEAIQQLVEDDPTLAETIEVVLAGALTDADREVAAPYPWVTLRGYMPHTGTVDLLRSADLLFLPMHDLAVGTKAGLVPGKTYEYLATGRPILAAIPDGDARVILEAAGNAILCRPADVSAMATAIREQVRLWRDGVRAPDPDGRLLERYERRALTATLAELLFDVSNSSSRPTAASMASLDAGAR
jgi:glycosyltransferase involved in cell wall biosynthesis